MAGVLEGFAVISSIVLVGYLLGRFGVLGPEAGTALSRFAFFVGLPALMFTTLAHADLSAVFSHRLSVAVLSALTVGAIFLVYALSRRREPGAVVIGTLSSFMLNSNNMGLPIAMYVFGNAAEVAPILLFQLILATPIGLSILGAIDEGRVSWRSILLQPVKNPIIIASAGGIIAALTEWTPPPLVEEPLILLGGAGIPVILVAFGMSLHGEPPLKHAGERADVLVATALKTVAMPIVAYLAARFLFGFEGRELFAATLLAALPTAQNVFAFAVRYRQGVTLARDTVLVTTVLAIPALIIIAALMAP